MAEVYYLPSVETKEVTPQSYIADNGADLMRSARAMREKHQHREGFGVGAVAVVSSLEGNIEEFKAANRNLLPGSNNTKLCAEQRIIANMIAKGFAKVEAMIVSGPPQPDTQSRLITPTLHSCGECREHMEDTLETPEDMVLVHVDPLIDAYDIYTLSELVTLHDVGPTAKPEFNYFYDPGFNNFAHNAQPFLEGAKLQMMADDLPSGEQENVFYFPHAA